MRANVVGIKGGDEASSVVHKVVFARVIKLFLFNCSMLSSRYHVKAEVRICISLEAILRVRCEQEPCNFIFTRFW